MTTDIVVAEPRNVVSAADWLPVMQMGQALQRRKDMVQFVQGIMIEGADYGKIPGTDKNVLLKAGAEKLCSFFGLSPQFVLAGSTEDWLGEKSGGEAFIYYRFLCLLSRGERVIGSGEGSCNSWESKYRYRWVKAHEIPPGSVKTSLLTRDSSVSEFTFSVDKAESSGKYGKPKAHWDRFREAIANGTAVKGKREAKGGKTYDTWEIPDVSYRVPNPDVADIVNTVLKMAQKRALVAATLIAVNASDYFTQDLDDQGTQEAAYTYVDAKPEPKREAQVAESEPETLTPEVASGDRAHDEKMITILSQQKGLGDEEFDQLLHAHCKKGWIGELDDEELAGFKAKLEKLPAKGRK